MENLEFFTEDWKKIPQNYRYLLIFGAFFIFNAWLLDHWLVDGQLPYHYLGQDIRSLSYGFGLSLILIASLFIIIKQFYLYLRVLVYRAKYPASELNKTYHLGWFKEKLILFDRSGKTFYHVRPLKTAQDLMFEGRGWYFHVRFNKGDEYSYDDKGNIFRTKGFKDGGFINTQF